MNILIYSWRGPGHPNAGGAEQATLQHASGWIMAGHEVVLFTSYYKGAKKTEIINGVKVIRSGDQFIGVKIYAFLWYIFGKHSKFDLVIDEFHGIPFFTPLYIKARKLAFIHEVAKEVWKLNPWPRPFNIIPTIGGRLLEPFIFKVLYKKIHFMTVSNSTKEDLIKFGIPKNNISVIYNGVKLYLPKKKPEKELKYTAMYLGAISLDKGTFDALKVFSEIERKDDRWQFWVVGSGSDVYMEELKKLSSEAKINNKIKFWGYVSDKKKFLLLSSAHVLINPSVHEGWGLVNIEANSVGTPVIAYNVHGIRESVKDDITGILVKKGEYRKMAEEIIKLMQDKTRYDKFQKSCISWSNKFKWEKSQKESIKLIENI